MKRLTIIIPAVLAAASSCTPQAETVVTATHVIISEESVSMQAGGSCTLTAQIYPPEVSDPGIVWSSMDDSIAGVAEGAVHAVAPGVTYIVATSADGRAKASCRVEVRTGTDAFLSVIDSDGYPVNALWRYPGAVETVYADCEDADKQTFTWTSSAPEVIPVNNGVIAFGYSATDKPGYLCYAEADVSVSIEDGTSAALKAVSSILSDFRFGEGTFKAGSSITLNPGADGELALLSDAGGQQAEIPADYYTVTSSSPSVIDASREGNGWKLTAGTGGEAILRITPAGTGQIDLVNVTVAKSLMASLSATTSSTLIYTWTAGESDEDDIARPYTIALYRDAACTDPVVSFEISAGNDCWNGKKPKFVFAGLQSGTTYYFKAVSNVADDVRSSQVIAGTTDEFTIVDASAVTDAGAGDVILAEDFSEIGWGCDEFEIAAGFEPGTKTLDILSGTLSSDDGTFQVYNANKTRLFDITTITPDDRLSKWGFFGNSAVYAYAGYVRVGSTAASNRTHIVTPALEGIPAGKTATIDVTVTTCKNESNSNDVAVFLEDYSALGKSALAKGGYKFTGVTLSDGHTVQAVSRSWTTKTVRIEGATASSCIVVGSSQNISGKNRFCFSDITVKIVEIN